MAVVPGPSRDTGTPMDVKKFISLKKTKLLDVVGLFLGWLAATLVRGSSPTFPKLPKKNEKYKDGVEAEFLGYGLSGKPSNELKTTKMSIYSSNKCKKSGGKSLKCYQDKKRTGAVCQVSKFADTVH